MGSSQGKGDQDLTNSELLKKLAYVLTEHSKNFNQINVYRLSEKPYDYYMRLRETVIDSQNSRKNIALKRELYKSLDSIRCLVKVEASEVKSVIDLCSNILEFDSYGRYHNYTLENAIDCKLNREKRFKQADLFYIMDSLLQVGEKVNQILGKSYKGFFKAYKIYLSTDGQIKLYPFQILSISGNSLTSYQQDNITNSQSLQQVQVNITPKKGGEDDRIRNYKDDLKDLAILIIQLVLLNKQEDIGTPNKEQLQFCLGRQIGQGLKQLLLNLITYRGQYTYESVNNQLQLIRQRERIEPSDCIRLEEDILLRESQIMKRQEEDILSQKEQQLKRLSSSNQNLVPSKIELIYYRNTLGNNQ